MNKQYTYSPYDAKTRKLLPHVQSAFINTVVINQNDVDNGVIYMDERLYTLVVSASLRRLIKESKHGYIVLRVSFQKHVDEYVAIPNTRTMEN